MESTCKATQTHASRMRSGMIQSSTTYPPIQCWKALHPIQDRTALLRARKSKRCWFSSADARMITETRAAAACDSYPGTYWRCVQTRNLQAAACKVSFINQHVGSG